MHMDNYTKHVVEIFGTTGTKTQARVELLKTTLAEAPDGTEVIFGGENEQVTRKVDGQWKTYRVFIFWSKEA